MVTATLRTAKPKSEAAKKAEAALGIIDVGAQQVDGSKDAENLVKELGLETDTQEASAAVKAIATRPALAVPTTRFSDMSDGGFEGEWSSSELKFPTLKIVQGSGPLTLDHPVGSIILGDERILEPTDPKAKTQVAGLRVIPWKISKGFTEDLPDGAFEQQIMPRTFKTQAEVEAVGGIIGYNTGVDAPHFRPSAACYFLIEQPDTELGLNHPQFSQELGGKNYAVAAYYATKSGFTNGPKVIFQAQLQLMETVGTLPSGKPDRRLCVFKHVWSMRAVRKQRDTFTYVVPELKLTRDLTPPVVREFILESLFGRSSEQTATITED